MRQPARVGLVVLLSLSMAGCASVRTVNGVDVHDPSTDQCARQPFTCILLAGVLVGGTAALLAGRRGSRGGGASNGAGATTPTTPTTPTLPTVAPTTTTTTSIGPGI
jgi:hypothetical protein